MRNPLLGLSIVLAFVGCAKKETPVSIPAPSPAAVAAKPRGTGPCPSGTGSDAGDVPKLTVKSGDGQVIVCGQRFETKRPDGRTVLAGYSAYRVDAAGSISSPIAAEGADEHVVVFEEAGKFAVIDQVRVAGDWKDSLKSTYECNGPTCRRTPRKCVLDRGRLSRDGGRALQKVRARMKAAEVADENDIGALFDAAVAGSADARRLFEQRPPELRLDGPSAERFHSAQIWLNRLKVCR
jgi:hypothetical protein